MIEERKIWKREIFLNNQCSIVLATSHREKVLLAEALLAKIRSYFRQMPPLGAVQIRLPFFDRLAIDEFSNAECIPLFSALPPRSFELDSMTSLPVFLEKTIGWSQKIVKVTVDSRLLLTCSDPSGQAFLGDHSAQQRAADMLAVALGRIQRRGIPAQDCTLFLECMFLYLRALYEAVRKIQRESIYVTV